MHKSRSSELQLLEAKLSDYPIVKNLAKLYVYDMSKYCGWPVNEKGILKCRSFKNYFKSSNCFPFLIKMGKEIAGFVLINKVGTDKKVDWNIGEFFILGKFQRSGVGTQVANNIYNLFKGEWETAVIPNNKGALKFWRTTIVNYIDSNFIENEKILSAPEPHKMIVFRFNNS